MHKTKSLRAFNLNTLPVLREILAHGSVSKAALALNVSQPALSATLKQLRAHFDDDLLVRTPIGMKLTEKAERVLAPLERAIDALYSVVRSEGQTGDAVTFTIATTDHIISRLAVPLLRNLLDNATLIRPNFVNTGPNTVDELMSGEIDMAIFPRSALMADGASSAELSKIVSLQLFTENFVVIGRADDPCLGPDMTVEAYLRFPHISFSINPNKHVTVEQAHLAINGYKQNELMQVSTSTLLPDLVMEFGCLALLPRHMAESAAVKLPLQLFTPPIVFPPMEWVALWHQRSNDTRTTMALVAALQKCALAFLGGGHGQEATGIMQDLP
jgi:LysR family transcriptional regulator, nod-box dependent transcriptional activator